MQRHVLSGVRSIRIRPFLLLALGATLAAAIWLDAQGAAGQNVRASASKFKAKLVKVASGFAFPTNLTGTAADPKAYYVVERAGRIWIVRNGKKVPHPFLDIHTKISIAPTSEQGMLSLAFDPNYALNRTFYVDYTDTSGNEIVARFHRSKNNPNKADASSEQIIMDISHQTTNRHYAGQLQFGPKDGDLYISVGDGGVPADANDTAQHLNTLLGKILRIDVHHSSRHHLYRIPKGNPFAHRAGALPQIYAYGLRNPFRFSFDSKTGAVWIGDVGENTWEEIDYRTPRKFPGTNFGWPHFEGPVTFNGGVSAPGAVSAVINKHHYGGGMHEHWCAIMGGYVEHDPRLPALANHYLFADHCSGEIDVARISGTGHAYGVVPTGLSVGGLVNGFGLDGSRRLYIISEDGSIYRFVKR